LSGPKRRYLTTAIDYANGLPHIGHALEKIGADAMVRYWRLQGENVHFVIGMDEHGQKVMQSAQAEGITPQEWVDRISGRFADTWRVLGIGNDDFIRTSQPRHHRAVHALIKRIEHSGDLYKGTYSGYYCVGCEAYKTEEELQYPPAEEGEGPPFCPIHPSRELQWMKEENWFFRLSAYQDRLLRLLDEHPDFVRPEIRRNEVRKVIEGGLRDLSVSRSNLTWGIPWPDEPGQTVYVWLDALTNYLSAAGFPDEGYRNTWPADVHVIGKDITRFHCIYWPAFLMSAGVELPRSVWVHGFVTYAGRKESKSEGVKYDLQQAIAQHGAEPLRYFLLREVPWSGDGDITRERFDERYTTELANDLGNLASRVLSMIDKYRQGVIPARGDSSLDRFAREAVERYCDAMDASLLHKGIQAALELTAEANVFVEQQAPWTLAKDPARGAELNATLSALAHSLGTLATLLHPVMPNAMEELASRIGLERVPFLDELDSLDLEGQPIRRGEPLFPRDDLEVNGKGPVS
jgi:methionyl-tRNA synthetase